MKYNKILTGLFMAALSGVMTSYAADLTPDYNSITEDFNSMWNASTSTPLLQLPSGWKIDKNLNAPRRVGSWNSAVTTVENSGGPNLPSNAKNGTWNFGPLTTDRAIGGFTTTVADGTRCINVMTSLSNSDPSKIITSLDISYNIEKYRTCANDAGFVVALYTSKDGENWTPAGDNFSTFFPKETDTANGASVVPISSTAIQNRNLRTHVEPAQTLYLAWNISVASGSSPDKAPGLAIDDVAISANFADDDPDWVETPEINHSGIYIRGVDGWDAIPEWEFNKLSDTQYEIRNKTISGSFKVGDSGWSSVNYGSNGANITMGEPYELTAGGSSSNISCGSNVYPCSRILLTIDGEKATLLLEPNTSTEGLTSVYMVGDFNNWNYMSTDGQLTLDPTDNLFKGRIGLTKGKDGLSHWMIYQRLALAGAWGLDQDATVASVSGTLTAGDKGHVATDPGTYDVTFDITTGEYTLTKLSANIVEMVIHPANTLLVPNVPEQVKVLSLNNSLIHYNDQARVFNEIAAAQGKDAVWTKHTNLGKTLQYHWEEGEGYTDSNMPGAKMMVRSDAWSHIILQEQTALPRTDIETFRNSVKQWVEYIRENCPNPNAVIILPMNWHYAQDWSNFAAFNQQMIDNYTNVASDLGVVVCPVGVAYGLKYQDAGGPTTESEWFLPGDDRHPTIRATYLAALMEYSIIFNESPAVVTYYPTYTTENDSKPINATIAAEMCDYASKALQAYTNTVNHHDASVKFSATFFDDFGMEVDGGDVAWRVSPEGATIFEGDFIATSNGTYTVTAIGAGLHNTATVIVTDAVTEVPEIPAVVLNNGNLDYSQDFNSMGSAANATMPEGWRIDRTDNPREVGTFLSAVSETSYAGGPDMQAQEKNGIWNFYSSADNNDRAVGGITSGVDGAARAVNVYLHIFNDGNKNLQDIDISYNVEKYRNGSNTAGYTVKLYYSSNGKTWTEAGSNFTTTFPASGSTIGASVVPIETKNVAGTLPVIIPGGTDLYLAWNISVSSGTSCNNAPALAIDDFTISASLPPVPHYDYHIYIDNQTGYESSALYAWTSGATNKEIMGAWPGQYAIDYTELDNTLYEVYGHNESEGTFNFIYNNNNQGSQLPDLALQGGRDYYLKATPTALTIINSTGIEDLENTNGSSLKYNGNKLSASQFSPITVYSLTGARLLAGIGEVSVESLQSGVYIAVAECDGKPVTMKFLKN